MGCLHVWAFVCTYVCGRMCVGVLVCVLTCACVSVFVGGGVYILVTYTSPYLHMLLLCNQRTFTCYYCATYAPSPAIIAQPSTFTCYYCTIAKDCTMPTSKVKVGAGAQD